LQIKTKIVSSYTADSKPVKQEVDGTVMGKIDMSSFQMLPSVLKYSYNPDELSFPSKYLLAIEVNLS